jgi:23S rRNA (cytidine1920-2'-O)/16S rRNA (cytidine1409-2'-O)-methyltransferase
MTTRVRADSLLAERGLAGSRTAAAETIRAGDVRLGRDGPVLLKPSQMVPSDAELLVAEGRRFVSRAGIKLDNALEQLGLDVSGRHCLDVGASTGGFTDCLLQRGAARVIALDVGHGQLDWGLRQDDRVDVLERVNAREISPGDLAFAPEVVTVDVSFISLTKLLDPIAAVMAPNADLLAMVKPQFELGRAKVKGGVVRDPELRREAVDAVSAAIEAAGFELRGAAESGLAGPKGNLETFVWAAKR